MTDEVSHGPLAGLTIIEMAGIGPVPFAGTVLVDMGARVIRVDRVADRPASRTFIDRQDHDPMLRGRESIAVDLKRPEGVAVVRELAKRADALLEGFRPGVMERMGLGPEVLLEANPQLVIGRMTGWGQSGPLAPRAGHDINYISIAGILGAIGPSDGPPQIPLNLVGDFGGGTMMLVAGVLAQLLAVRLGARGGVVDASMVEGASYLATMMHGFMAQGLWTARRGVNQLDGGSPFYGVYACKDDEYVSVGALEPKFFAELVERLGCADRVPPERQYVTKEWPAMRAIFTEIFRSKTRDDWAEIFAESDACVTPVLSLAEAPRHPHNVERSSFLGDGHSLPRPAPRFTHHPVTHLAPAGRVGRESRLILEWLGYSRTTIDDLQNERVVAGAEGADAIPRSVES
ncbi:MAG: CaiB/BaiF CoA transferase family protein [Acidimicrobiales bacterium]